ncbi:MAG: guanylate kinase [Lachnospiraceae bacterium]
MCKGVLLVVSGFSGAGKGTLMKELVKRYDNYALSISATTRSPRPGEQAGREYFFKTQEEFEQLRASDALIEYARYVDNYYGTPKEYVQEKLSKGFDVILEIEIQGALKVKEKRPDAVLLFVLPPTGAELKNRLSTRGSESDEQIRCRMNRAIEEAQGMNAYDYLVINDSIDTCVEQIHQIVTTERHRPCRNQKLIEQIRHELGDFK